MAASLSIAAEQRAGGARADEVLQVAQELVVDNRDDPGLAAFPYSNRYPLALEFDVSDVWIRGPDVGGAGAFYFPTVLSSATITGAHTIATNSTAPAARFLEIAGGIGGISETLGNPDYVDFIIDGVLTTTFAGNGPAVLAPSAGDNLVIAHLRDDLEQFETLHIASVSAYEFTNKIITIKEVDQVIIDIDIKPGSDPNSINCNNNNGVIPVVILTTDDFDATTVDHTTVTFEGARETHVDRRSGEPRRHEEDVDGDGDIDLVFHFRLGDTDLTCESTEGTLTGETFDAQAIEGTDRVNMIGS